MAKYFTEQDILNATTYMPIELKGKTAKAIAVSSIAVVNVNMDITSDSGDKSQKPLPPRYTEDVITKMAWQLRMLLVFYLKQDLGSEDMTAEMYDDWGRVAVFNQLDRLKQSKDPEVRNKVYDILDDYRELCKMVSTEIAMELTVRNDPFNRIAVWLMEQIPPELIAKLKDGLVSARDELSQYRESRKQKGLE